MRRFPLHRLLLMVVALLAFGRLYYVTHRDMPAPAPRKGPAALPTPPDLGPAACRSLDAVLADVLQSDAGTSPDARDAGTAWSAAHRQLGDCPTPSAEACARGAALASRAPPVGGDAVPRAMLTTLCERCAPQDNPCGHAVTRALQEAARRGNPDLQEARWSLEHAGAAMGAACQELARLAVGPAALSGPDLEPPLLALAEELAPTCVQTEQLPAPLLSAAAVQQGARAPRLASLFTGRIVETAPIEPDQQSGPGDAFRAFDQDELSGVKLPVGTGAGADGALRLGYAPPLKQVVSFQVRATGPGTLRALVRAPEGVGRKDGQGDAFHVDPTVCRFRGTGAWEICKPAVPLLDVDAVSVLPERPGVELKELEIIGAR
ncbi:hypothetical protein OV207_20595 [Corallococcus sp. BB11-1]|uniref:hypothetical protein n=1 Tax=Corallococcus sp. BB11-1 TaxID=2996783 RepID=UPI00226DC9D6|nr:hypothetical protein [Corallococcus sp. BB11-1]MCY1033864.1 hypothetical protein [Corallococcus sp. BB11-1]